MEEASHRSSFSSSSLLDRDLENERKRYRYIASNEMGKSKIEGLRVPPDSPRRPGLGRKRASVYFSSIFPVSPSPWRQFAGAALSLSPPGPIPPGCIPKPSLPLFTHRFQLSPLLTRSERRLRSILFSLFPTSINQTTMERDKWTNGLRPDARIEPWSIESPLLFSLLPRSSYFPILSVLYLFRKFRSIGKGV